MNCAQTLGGCGKGFSRARRLTEPGQFRRVFAEPKKIHTGGFVVLYRPNDLERARLGLVIAKKHARRSVDRSRLKRIARESFRANCQTLPGVDIVILCSRGVLAVPNPRLFETLARAWTTIRKSTCVES